MSGNIVLIFMLAEVQATLGHEQQGVKLKEGSGIALSHQI
jgi:hypothetical protein